MASAKRKPAKRTARSATRPHSKAAHAASTVAKSAANTQHDWSQRGAQQWQQGANEWAKQSAKLLPFAGGNAAEATKQAAEQVKTATESFMRAGNDIMSQMFGGTDPMAQWNGWFSQATSKLPKAEDAAEKMRSFTRESAAQANKAAGDVTRALGDAGALARENAEAMVECSNITIAVSKEIGAELINYTNRAFSQNVELGKQLLACRTLNDMFDLSSKFMKTNLDGFFSESVKLSEKLFQCATDVSEPLNDRISDTSDRVSKMLAA